MQRRSALVILTILSVLTALFTGIVIASGASTSASTDFEIIDAIETPSETIETEEGTYTIDEIGAINPGESIKVHVTAPDRYHLTLYNSKENEEYHNLTDAETVDIGSDDDKLDTSELDPGTYMLVFEPNNGDREATPVVIQGYDITLEYPRSAEKGSEIKLEATVESTSDLDRPDAVDVAVWDGTNVTEVTLDHEDGSNYETTVSLTDFAPGTYDIYGTVVGDEKVRGYSTALAVEDGTSLTVTANESDGDESEDNNSTDDSNNETDDKENNESTLESDNTGSNSNTSNRTANETDNKGSPGDTDNRTNEGASGNINDRTEDIIQPNSTNGTELNQTGNETSVQNGDGLGTPAAIPVIIAFATLLLGAIIRNR